ncbi:MAG: hypothetical protein QHJ73_04970, partial [Armatimonadota bacterium]|nr:hypothetical protein [Armatimonadota bacterium]
MLATLVAVREGAAASAGAVVLDDFEEIAPWQPRADGGQPPAFHRERAVVKEGAGALRVVYRNGAAGWGNLQRPMRLPAAEGILLFWVYKERSQPSAAMHLWLEEPDGDLWVTPVLEGGAPFGKWSRGWRRLAVPLSAFRFDGRGNKRPQRGEVVRMLIGCNFGDLEGVVDHLTFEPAAAATEEPLVLRRRILLGENTAETTGVLGRGWYEGEGPEAGRWTGRDGEAAQLRLKFSARRDAFITLRGQIPASRWAKESAVKVDVDGRPAQGLSVDPTSGRISFQIPGSPVPREVQIALRSGLFVPARAGASGDTRTLGMKLTALEVAEFPYTDTALPPKRPEKGSIAVLKDDLPVSGTPSDPEHLARVLRGAGYGVTFLSATDLVHPRCLNAERFDLLVLPYGGVYPAEGRDALVAFLRSGGAFLSMGGYAFNDPVLYFRGRWVTQEGWRAAVGGCYVDVGAPGDTPFLFGDWYPPESGAPEWGGAPGVVTKRWTGARAGVRLYMKTGENYTLRVSIAFRGVEWAQRYLKDPLPVRGRVWLNGNLLGSFEGDAGTTVLEYRVPASYARADGPGELLFETETWSPARLGQGEDTRELGVAVNWVHAVPEGVSEMDLAKPPKGFDFWINTARGKPQDSLVVDPEQIGAFDPSYPLRDAVAAVAAPNQYVVPAPFRLSARLEGY